MIKQYVDVICFIDKIGNVKPLFLVFNDKKKIPIIKVQDICIGNNLKKGTNGIRFTCLFDYNRLRHLYYEQGKWYVEAYEQ